MSEVRNRVYEKKQQRRTKRRRKQNVIKTPFWRLILINSCPIVAGGLRLLLLLHPFSDVNPSFIVGYIVLRSGHCGWGWMDGWRQSGAEALS